MSHENLLTVMATATSHVHTDPGLPLYRTLGPSEIDPGQHRDEMEAERLSNPAGRDRDRGHGNLRALQSLVLERLEVRNGCPWGSRLELLGLEAARAQGELSWHHPDHETDGYGAEVDGQSIEAANGPLVGNAKPSAGEITRLKRDLGQQKTNQGSSKDNFPMVGWKDPIHVTYVMLGAIVKSACQDQCGETSGSAAEWENPVARW